MSYSKERFQEPKKATPVALLSSGSLQSTATTSLGLYYVPLTWGQIYIKALGMHMLLAGGAQTIAGVLGILVNGVEPVDVNGNPFRISSVVSHAAGSSVEVATNDSPNNQAPGPVYVPLNAGDILEWVVVTAGTGAGDQTCLPYVIYSLSQFD